MDLKSVLEAVLFSAQKPMNQSELRSLLKETADKAENTQIAKALAKTRPSQIEQALSELAAEFEAMNRSYKLVCVAGGWQFVTRPEFAPWLQVMVGAKTRPPRLSHPALETLAIIAYRQPLTRSEMEQIRGVSVDGVMQKLMERSLVEVMGESPAPGRPKLYGTTVLFLEYFGLGSLEELPAADELRRIHVERPAGLATVEPGLATAPPGELRDDITESGQTNGDDQVRNDSATENEEAAAAAAADKPYAATTGSEPENVTGD